MLWLPDSYRSKFTVAENTESALKTGSRDLLLEVSRALKTDSYDVRHVRSIPDIYSKARLFDMAIRMGESNADDLFFQTYRLWVEYEWRAMLAVLVLADNINIPISTAPFYPDLNNPDLHAKFNDDGKDDDGNDILSPLEKILYRRRPNCDVWRESRKTDTVEEAKTGWTWGKGLVYLLETEGRKYPIAISSPSTLIVPAADGWNVLWEHCRKELPWIEPFASERVIDPDRIRDENPVDKIKTAAAEYIPVLYSWLELYRQELIKIADDTDWCPKKENIEYLCGPFDSDGKEGVIRRFLNELGENHISGDVSRVFSFTNITSITAPYVPNDTTEIGMAGEGNTLRLFIDCDAATIGGRDLNNVTAIDRVSVRTVRDEHMKEKENARLRKSGRDIPEFKSPLLERIRGRAQLVFSDDLLQPSVSCSYYEFEGSENICADAVIPNAGTWHFVREYDNRTISRTYWIPMPFTRDGFEYFKTNKDISYTVSGGFKEDSADIDTVSVTIEIPMKQGSAGVTAARGGQVYQWTKTYKNNGENGEGNPVNIINSFTTDLCTAGLWPKQPVTNWKSYYFFCLREGAYYLEPEHSSILVENPREVPCGNISGKPGTAKYYRMSAFPEYLRFFDGNGKVLGYVPLNTETRESGTITSPYQISVDFGTSSTAIFRKSNGEINKFSGKGLGSSAVCFNPNFNNDGKADYLTQYFIPHDSKDFQIPFQSLLHDFKKNEESIRDHIFDAVIFHKLLTPEQTNPRFGEIESNLKWSREREAGYRLEAFFKQNARMAVLDALKRGHRRIELFASYPGAKAGGNAQIRKLVKQFEDVVHQDIERNGNNALPAISFHAHPDITEGLAAAKYFQKSANEKFRCVIDIGGGSSDFFVYQRMNAKNILYSAIDSSVKFGSRDLLVYLLKEDAKKYIGQYKGSLLYRLACAQDLEVRTETGRVSLYNYLDDRNEMIEEKIRHMVEYSDKDDGNFRTDLENFLSYPVPGGTVGDILHQALTNNGAEDNRDRQFLSILAVGIAAIVYYGGMLARTFSGTISHVDLRFAGNGSKVLTWLRTEYDNPNSVEDFLREVFNSALCGTAVDLSVELSRETKLEAAKGMLEDIDINLDGGKATTVTLAGEIFTDSGGTKYSATERVTNTHLYSPQGDARIQQVFFEDVECDEFDAFCKAYNSAVVKAYGTSTNRPMLTLDYKRDDDADYGSTFFVFDINNMRNNRETAIEKYITAVIKDSGSEMERDPFFFLEIKTLLNSLVGVFTK